MGSSRSDRKRPGSRENDKQELMIKFGPSGNSESFYNEGHKSTVEAPKWVKERGLDIYEYSFGKGVLMGENTANSSAPRRKNTAWKLRRTLRTS